MHTNMILFSLLLICCIRQSLEHGFLFDPPNRSSLFRFVDDPMIEPYKDKIKANYNDNQNFCGGVQHQIKLGYKCGICGDPYDAAQPRDNEAGGKYGLGIVVREYQQGSVIRVTVKLTAYHKGFFEFRLCPHASPNNPVTKECLDRHILVNLNQYSTKYKLSLSETSNWRYQIDLQLPSAISCDLCVLQWRYHAGNTWGCGNGRCCVGCGYQEEFYSCSDVRIISDEMSSATTTNVIEPTPSSRSTSTRTTTYKTSTSTNLTSTSTTMFPTRSTSISTLVMTSTTKPSTSKTRKLTTLSASITFESTSMIKPTPPRGNCISISENRSCEMNRVSAKLYQESATQFYQCVFGKKYIFDCPAHTVFNPKINVCDWPWNVPPLCH